MVLEDIKNRYSVRKFSSKKIESEKMQAVLEAARLAPSAKNMQPWKFIVITDDEKREQLVDICRGQKFVAEAPATIAICCNNLDYTMRCGHPASIIDGALASQNIAIQAVALGLGTCWIGSFLQERAQELISLPEGWVIVGLIPIGYPMIEKGNRKLKPVDEVISYNSF